MSKGKAIRKEGKEMLVVEIVVVVEEEEEAVFIVVAVCSGSVS